MRAIIYRRLGGPSVLELVERPIPEPGEGEVRIRVAVSGVNPTDWKSRSGMSVGALVEATVPNHDGAGVVDKLGAGVTDLGVGDRVWVTLAGMNERYLRTVQSGAVSVRSRNEPKRRLAGSFEPSTAHSRCWLTTP